HRSPDAWAPLRPCAQTCSRRRSDWRPREVTRTRVPRGAERGRDASSGQAEWLADDVPTTERFLGQRAIGLENQMDGFGEILPSLLETRSLRVRSGKLFHKGDVSLPNLLKHCGQLELHDFPPRDPM